MRFHLGQEQGRAREDGRELRERKVPSLTKRRLGIDSSFVCFSPRRSRSFPRFPHQRRKGATDSRRSAVPTANPAPSMASPCPILVSTTSKKKKNTHRRPPLATPNSAKNASSTAAEKSTIAWPSPTTSWRVLCGDGERDLRAAAAEFEERARTSLREGGDERRSLPTRPEVEGREEESPTFRDAAAASAAARGAVADAALRDELALLPLPTRLLDRDLDIEEAIADVKAKRIEA